MGILTYLENNRRWEEERATRAVQQQLLEMQVKQLQQAMNQEGQTFPLELQGKQRAAETEQMLLPSARFGALSGQIPSEDMARSPLARQLLQQMTGAQPPGTGPGGQQFVPMRGATEGGYNDFMQRIAGAQRPAALAGEKAGAEAGAKQPFEMEKVRTQETGATGREAMSQEGAMARTLAAIQGQKDIARIPPHKPVADPYARAIEAFKMMQGLVGGQAQTLAMSAQPLLTRPSDYKPEEFDTMANSIAVQLQFMDMAALPVSMMPEGPEKQQLMTAYQQTKALLSSLHQQLVATRGSRPSGSFLERVFKSVGPPAPDTIMGP